MIELRTLGGLDLHDAQGRELRVILAASKPAALLTYLAIATPRGFHRRDTLLALFWPELDQEHARGSLRQALRLMRRSMTAGALLTEGDDASALDRDMFWCDAVTFEELLDGGKEEEALALYRGALLDGFHLMGCLEFERWLEDERLRLKRRAAHAARSLAEQAEAQGNLAEAVEWSRKATAIVPNDETALRWLITLLDREGNRAGAIREHEAFAERLREDYEAEPAPETRDLIASVRAREKANGSVLPSAPLTKHAAAAVTSVTVEARRSWRTRGRAVAAVVVLGAIVAVGANVIRNGRGDAPALDPTRVLVDIFQNETGDPSLDPLGRMVTDRVTAGLTYTSFVDVVSLGTQLLSHEAVVPDAGPTEPSGRLRALARANGTGTVVWGSYYLQGDNLYFLGHVTNAGKGEELATIESIRGPVDDPVAAVEQLRERMMTTLATLTDPRLAKWMRYASKPSTFEAYTEFVEGMELRRNDKPAEAIPYFVRAAALDSDFTMASLWAASAYNWTGQRARGDSIRQALNRRRGQLASVDRLFLDYQLVFYSGDYDGALEAMRQVVDIAPGSEFLSEAGRVAQQAGRLPEAIEFITQIDPDNEWLGGLASYRLTFLYHMLGDHERELEALNRLRQVDPESHRTLRAGMRALAALGRIEELEGSIQEAVQRDPWWGGFRWFDELRAHGYPLVASDLAVRTLEWFEGRPSDWRRDPGQSYVYAKLLSVAGRWDESQAILEDVVPKAVGVPGGAYHNAALELAYVLARQGQRDQAYRAVGLTAWPNSLGVRSWVEAALGERERAVELLRERGRRPDIYGDTFYKWDSLRDYPPYQEFIRPRA